MITMTKITIVLLFIQHIALHLMVDAAIIPSDNPNYDQLVHTRENGNVKTDVASNSKIPMVILRKPMLTELDCTRLRLALRAMNSRLRRLELEAFGIDGTTIEIAEIGLLCGPQATYGGQELFTSKRNFDEIDRSGFRGFAKRNFDEIDKSGFSGFVGHRRR